MARDSHFDKAIILELASCYRAVVKSQKDQKLRTGVERLANYLLRQHDEQGGAGTLHLETDKRTLAGWLGMTPENLSRAVGTLRPYGVTVNGSDIALSKLDDLTRLANPNRLIDDQTI